MMNPYLLGWLGQQNDFLSRLGSSYRSGSSVSSDPNQQNLGLARQGDSQPLVSGDSSHPMRPGMSREEFERDYYSRGNAVFGAPSFADQQVDDAYGQYMSGQTQRPYGFGGGRREMMMSPYMNPMMFGLGSMMGGYGGYGMPYGMSFGGGYGMPYGGYYGGLGSMFGGGYF